MEHVVRETELGRVAISTEAIAQIVAHLAAESYGIVGMAGRRFPRLRSRTRLTDGVTVRERADGALEIDLQIVVEYGLKLAEIAATLRSRVEYEVERQTGIPVAAVEVRIEDARKS